MVVLPDPLTPITAVDVPGSNVNGSLRRGRSHASNLTVRSVTSTALTTVQRYILTMSSATTSITVDGDEVASNGGAEQAGTSDPASRVVPGRVRIDRYGLDLGAWLHLADERTRLSRPSFAHISVTPQGATLGAEVSGMDLRTESVRRGDRRDPPRRCSTTRSSSFATSPSRRPSTLPSPAGSANSRSTRSSPGTRSIPS